MLAWVLVCVCACVRSCVLARVCACIFVVCVHADVPLCISDAWRGPFPTHTTISFQGEAFEAQNRCRVLQVEVAQLRSLQHQQARPQAGAGVATTSERERKLSSVLSSTERDLASVSKRALRAHNT